MSGTRRRREGNRMFTTKTLLAAIAAGGLSLIVAVWALGLGPSNGHAPPSYRGDGIWTAALIKGMIENGWYLSNPAVGAPFGLDCRDFPMADNLHFGIMWLLTLGAGSYALVYNMFFLLTFPLTALVTLFTFRHFQLSYGTSIFGSVLFALLPGHLFRVAHLFLASYYLVP